MIFGWGKRSQSWKIDDNLILLATWRYFHLIWCPFAFKVQWHLISDKRSEDTIVSYDKVKEIFPEKTPNISLWYRYGLLFLIGVILFVQGITFAIELLKR